MSTEGPFGRRGGEEPDPREPAPLGPPPEPPLVPTPPAPPARSSRVTWLFGVFCVCAFAYITVNTIRTEAPGSRGVRIGAPLPAFSVPLASSDRRCEDDDGELRPCDANVDPATACRLRAPDVLTSCALTERGPVALAFIATRSERCQEQVDVLDRARRSHPDVQVGVVAVRGDLGDLRRLVAERRWGVPVGHDRDGAVSNLFAVAVCPTITFARRGGQVASTSLEFLDEAALGRRLEEIGG